MSDQPVASEETPLQQAYDELLADYQDLFILGCKKDEAIESARARAADRINRGVFSSNVDAWSTPESFMVKLIERFGHFDLDPCCLPSSAKAPKYFTPDDDGLTKPWSGRVFMNPPYGRTIGQWVAKARKEAIDGATVVCLLPARTDTGWWHDHVMTSATEVLLVRGRLHFGGDHERTAHNAPFPSAVVVFNAGGGPPALGVMDRA